MNMIHAQEIFPSVFLIDSGSSLAWSEAIDAALSFKILHLQKKTSGILDKS